MPWAVGAAPAGGCGSSGDRLVLGSVRDASRKRPNVALALRCNVALFRRAVLRRDVTFSAVLCGACCVTYGASLVICSVTVARD